MARIIECVPNCSEGRNKEIIEYIADAVRSVPGVALMDYSSDENHNRSVFTIVGDPDQMGEAAFRFAKACVEKIDMTKHHGEHPRMGAVDVIPFTPVKDVSMEECVELSKKVGQRIWEELKMPVTLYEESATAPHRRNLAAIRKGQFEGMPEKPSARASPWSPSTSTSPPPTSRSPTRSPRPSANPPAACAGSNRSASCSRSVTPPRFRST